MALVVTVGAVDQSAFLAHGSLTMKQNTFDFELLDPATVPNLGDLVVTTLPNWSGSVVSVANSDIVDLASGHKRIGIAAVNKLGASGTPATVALVGVTGAFTSVSGGVNKITPSFGQATTAGNLLVAWVGSTDSDPITTTASGWLQAISIPPTFNHIAIFYKPNCGAGEAAPEFKVTSTGGGGNLAAQLAEFSAVTPITPLDRTGSVKANLSPVTAQAAALDTTYGDLQVSAAFWSLSAPATCTTSDTFGPNATAVSAGNNQSTSTVGHYSFAYAVTTTNSNADSDLATSTGSVNNAWLVIASFRPKLGNAPFTLTDVPDLATYDYLLEDGSGGYLLEDGSGDLELEAASFGYRGLTVKTMLNADGTVSSLGSLTTYGAGLAMGQTLTLTSANLGYSAAKFLITNVTVTWVGLQTPAYYVEFGNNYLTLQAALHLGG